MINLGDAVHTIANPIAKGLDSVLGTDIEHCRGCAKRRAALNNLGDRIYDTFWKRDDIKSEEIKIMNQYIVVKQIAVEAETPEEAIAKSIGLPSISISVSPRPVPIQPGSPQSIPRPAPPGTVS